MIEMGDIVKWRILEHLTKAELSECLFGVVVSSSESYIQVVWLRNGVVARLPSGPETISQMCFEENRNFKKVS